MVIIYSFAAKNSERNYISQRNVHVSYSIHNCSGKICSKVHFIDCIKKKLEVDMTHQKPKLFSDNATKTTVTFRWQLGDLQKLPWGK